jgi:hypothetical protein
MPGQREMFTPSRSAEVVCFPACDVITNGGGLNDLAAAFWR